MRTWTKVFVIRIKRKGRIENVFLKIIHRLSQLKRYKSKRGTYEKSKFSGLSVRNIFLLLT